MARRAVSSDQAPEALGPYSQAIVAGDTVYCSGMAGIDPETGEVADGIEAQTEQALRNLAVVLEAAGRSMQDIVKTTIFYADVEDFGAAQRGLRSPHARPTSGALRPRQRATSPRPARLDRGDRGAFSLLGCGVPAVSRPETLQDTYVIALSARR